MSYSQEEMQEMILAIGDSEGNFLLASRIYAQKYPDRRHPNKRSFEKVFQRFRETGNINYLKRSRGPPLGPNKPGELLIKGPQVMKGYHNKPEETAKTMLDGWLRSGDIATYNERGVVFIADRLKELIKVRGYQVPPAELEEVIRSYPSVQDAAVIGIPHPIDGEVPRAYIMVKNNQQLDVEELKDFVAKKVAKYKQLKGGVQIVNSIPKNASGKILRKDLKKIFEDQGV